eukprot:6893632-Prymnesium_polylepis.1
MASFVRSAPPRRAEWSLEDAAQFAALKEFKLLQLLSRDKTGLRDGVSPRLPVRPHALAAA